MIADVSDCGFIRLSRHPLTRILERQYRKIEKTKKNGNSVFSLKDR